MKEKLKGLIPGIAFVLVVVCLIWFDLTCNKVEPLSFVYIASYDLVEELSPTASTYETESYVNRNLDTDQRKTIEMLADMRNTTIRQVLLDIQSGKLTLEDQEECARQLNEIVFQPDYRP